jgi:dTDP-glucose 4,6-dehydratase
MGRTVLITGGSGFIGTNIIRRLLATTKVNILVFDRATRVGRTENLPATPEVRRRRVHVIRGDITKQSDVEHAVKRSDIIVHLAAQTHTVRSLTDAIPTVKTNVLGTTVLLESAVRYRVNRFILFSSSEVYGNQMPGIPMDEMHPLNPVTPYAASKLAADRLAYSYFLTKGLPVTILRPFNAYGPYQHPEKMVPLFITRLLRNQPITLNYAGKQSRDWVYVEDHARAVELVLRAKDAHVHGEVFNIGTGITTPIRDIAHMILKVLGKNPKKFLRFARSSAPETMGNVGISKKAARVLVWKPSLTLEAGIRKTVEWYTANRSWWEGLPSSI